MRLLVIEDERDLCEDIAKKLRLSGYEADTCFDGEAALELLAVDVVIRPEDIDLVKPEDGTLQGVVTHLIFKGVHYEIEIMAGGFEWLVDTTQFYTVGTHVGIRVIPFNIQIMNKPESEDEEAAEIDV